MESSITFPTTFDPKFEKSAELIAYLTKGIAYRDNGDILVANKSELNKIIAEKYEQKDFIGANEILEAARNISTEWTPFKLAERVSKSVRLPMSTYLKLAKYASRNKLLLADSIRKILSVPMKKQLDTIAGSSLVVNERVEPLHRSLDNWSTTKKQKKIILDGNVDLEKYRDYSRYSLHCDYCFDERIYDLLKKPVERFIYEGCEENIPKEMVDRYISHLKVDDLPMENYIKLNDENDELTLEILTATIVLGFEFEDYEVFENEIIADFGVEAMEKFYRIFSIEEEYGVLCGYAPFDYGISGIVSVGAENKLYLENIEIDEQNRAILEARIYHEITDEEYEHPNIYVDRVKDAIENGDYDLATKINEKLAMNQTNMEISSWFCDILFDSTKSKVVTFIIPPALLGLLELAKGRGRMSDLVDEYLEVI